LQPPKVPPVDYLKMRLRIRGTGFDRSNNLAAASSRPFCGAPTAMADEFTANCSRAVKLALGGLTAPGFGDPPVVEDFRLAYG